MDSGQLRTIPEDQSYHLLGSYMQLRQLPETSTQISPSELATPPEASHQGRICPEIMCFLVSSVKFCEGQGQSGNAPMEGDLLLEAHHMMPYCGTKEPSTGLPCLSRVGFSLVMPSSTSGPHYGCERQVLGWEIIQTVANHGLLSR